MTRLAGNTAIAGSPESLERLVRARVDSLSYLPTSAAVAMRFVELGKNPDAEPADYAKVISADSSLCSKLLALANSSWAGVRQEVTNVRTAVNLLGLGTVRTLAISYCMTGLHNELRLSRQESRMFWQASLCKAVAAKTYATLFEPKLADEAFVSGLFQDFALPVMYSVAKDAYLGVLRDPDNCVRKQLQKERQLFRLDHAEVGQLLAQKLQLPDLFVDAVTFHHNPERLGEFVSVPALHQAACAAALLPHLLDIWGREDVEALTGFLAAHAPSTEVSAFLASVQEEFSRLYRFFHEGDVPDAQLTELLEEAARESADNTEQLVSAVNELLQNVAAMGTDLDQRVKQLEDSATRDQLTDALTRDAFAEQVAERLAQATARGSAFALVYADVDSFKQINDNFGHDVGDQVLKTVAEQLLRALPGDALLTRPGGDEFAAFFNCPSEQQARKLGQRAVNAVAAQTIPGAPDGHRLSISLGLLYVRPTNRRQELDVLLKAADKLMYEAKRDGGNQMKVRCV